MDSEFWKSAWEEGRTGFHQAQFNDKLLKYFPRLEHRPGQKVLVPLCGKTRDILWLRDQGLWVRGFELYEDAVRAFFSDNGFLAPTVTSDGSYTNYRDGDITISCGDFFRLRSEAEYDFVYDRAALVALPPEMREDYVKIIHRALKAGGKYLLVTYQYAEEQMQGPPFSISDQEILRLYKDLFRIEQFESERPTEGGA